MTISERALTAGDRVHHERFGLGTVVAVDAATAVVRFESGIQECRLTEFALRAAPDESIAAVALADSNQAIVRAQAEAIQSVNQTWGVFAPSRIQLLPHQLWVCKKVLERWPTRWLVADDVRVGRQRLNLSEWGKYNQTQAENKLDEICGVVQAGAMPPKPYLVTHPHAKLNEMEVKAICTWAETEQKRLAAQTRQ